MKSKAGIALLAAAAVGTSVVAVAAAAAGQGADAPQAAATQSTQARSCKGASIAFMGPITGGAASIGQEQLNFSKLAVIRFNAVFKTKYRLRQFDTQLDAAQAATRATQVKSNSSILGVVGPAGSQEVISVAKTFSGLGYVSSSATRTTLTVGPDRIPTFSRVVPNDSAQAPATARFIRRTLNATRVWVIDDQSAYSVPLANGVQANLNAAGATVTRESVSQTQSDFSSIITRIGANIQVVYLPWQLAPKATLFYNQLREQGKRAVIVGSDGLDSGDFLPANGSYFFAFAPDIRSSTDKTVKALRQGYQRRFGAFQSNFGPPTYLATQVVLTALHRACKDGKATRAEVAGNIRKVTFKTTILGSAFKFTKNGDVVGARFYPFKIVNGKAVSQG